MARILSQSWVDSLNIDYVYDSTYYQQCTWHDANVSSDAFDT